MQYALRCIDFLYNILVHSIQKKMHMTPQLLQPISNINGHSQTFLSEQ